jgi:(E)-4-hydroxy-3-methylbut-2-enyl-diphosphate synthase
VTERRLTREVQVGDIGIGGENPIRVQSMITAKTQDIQKAADQIQKLHISCAEIIRVTAPTIKDAQALAEIKQQLRQKYENVPLVADVHHKGVDIAIEAARHVEKVRINPGLFVYHSLAKEKYTDTEIEEQLEEIDRTLKPVLDACSQNGVALRLGVNHGSLSKRLTAMYGDTPEGMVQSAMEYLKVSESHGFKNIVISLKANRVPVMVEANRLMVEQMARENMDYPIHLGVTEAGLAQPARVKSSIGIGSLLLDGIGDTIRVSLTEDPVKELSVAYDILQATGARRTHAEIISCPSCGRAKFDVEKVTKEITQRFNHLPLAIAPMGCVVNGGGEAKDADYAYVGKGGGKIALYRGKEELRIVDQSEAVGTLESLIKSDGNWVDPLSYRH